MPVSPAQRAQRRAAGKKSGQVRGGHDGSDGQGDPNAPMPVSNDPEVDVMMEGYVKLAGKPASWPDVKNCEQVRAEIYRTRAAARQDAIDAKALITRDQLRARDEALSAAIKSALSSVTDSLSSHVPPDRILAFQKAAAAWIAEVRTKLADQIEGME